jgi:hypothetical protein
MMGETTEGNLAINYSMEVFSPNYDLSSEALQKIQDDMVANIESQIEEPGIVASWIQPKSRYANFIRNYEAAYFPEVKDVTSEDENNTTFLALVDTRESAKRVVHGATITGESVNQVKENETGLYTIDALIERGNFSLEDFYSYYKLKNIDVANCVSVETNFIIGERADKFGGFGSAELVYLAIVQLLEKRQQAPNTVGAFATLNGRQRSSFRRIGIDYELLMGAEEMNTPESELGIDSQPVFIPYDDQTRVIFDSMGSKLPVVNF